jgi:GT2 family glycosyltransferase
MELVIRSIEAGVRGQWLRTGDDGRDGTMEMGRGDPRVAVVMITHNRVDEVLRSLDELSRLPERPRIVVVDNDSNDGTARAVSGRFPDVLVLDAGGNLGAAGRTIGARHVESPYVAFCDDDTWWKPGCLSRAADLFDARPRLAVLTGRILVGPEDEQDPICCEFERSPLPRAPGMPGPPLLGFLAGASVVRRAAFLEAGGFEPRFFVGGEEELLAADLAARGGWICYVPELVVHHHPSPRRDEPARRATMVRNALWFAWLRRPLPVALCKTVQLAWQRPRDLASLRGLAAALRGLPWALSRRRVLPPEVESGLRLLEARR